MIPVGKPHIGQEEIEAVTDVLKSGIIAQGPVVAEVEKDVAARCGCDHGVAVNSGTAALHCALHAVGVGPGDEVIVPPFSFIATSNVVLMQGAKPVFVDIEAETFCIDPEKIEAAITDKTKAIIVVDLYGQVADYAAISAIAKKHNLAIVEDAAQAIGAEVNGVHAGSFGDAAAISFYATKNITSAEGGMMVTSNDSHALSARLFRQHGRKDLTGYEYHDLGYNYRTTDVNAAILKAQLAKLDSFTEARIDHATALTEGLKDCPGIRLPAVARGKHVFHQYTIVVEEDCKLSRDELQKALKEKGVGSAVYYPQALHECDHYQAMGYTLGDFPVAEKMARSVLSLPVHPGLTEAEVNKVIAAVKECTT